MGRFQIQKDNFRVNKRDDELIKNTTLYSQLKPTLKFTFFSIQVIMHLRYKKRNVTLY